VKGLSKRSEDDSLLKLSRDILGITDTPCSDGSDPEACMYKYSAQLTPTLSKDF
jgi:hypothetical protein